MASLDGLTHLTIRIADFVPVKAVIDAANEVCDAEGDAPWTLAQTIDSLRQALEALSRDEA